jgi:hypothetical protein
MGRDGTHDERSVWFGEALVGTPVDLAPWAYVWRADREIQPQAEAAFIPRRLERLDRVYRTAREALPPDQLKSIHYDMPDLLKALPPPPQGRLRGGLLWTGGLAEYQVELHWPEGSAIPVPESVEVRAYPTSFGWFGFTVDRVLAAPTISPDRRTWTYQSGAPELMDSSYNARVPAATEMVAVFGAPTAVPEIRLVSPSLGDWQRLEIEIEWGFLPGFEEQGFDGRLEPYVAQIGPLVPLADRNGVAITGAGTWRSKAAKGVRRGLVVSLLYAPAARPGLDSRVTLWSSAGGVTFSVKDLDTGPILIPRAGLFICKAGGGLDGRRVAADLAARGLKSVRQMTYEHREAGSWEELMREVRLWTCPAGTVLAPFPPVQDPPMQVQLSDERWTAAWRAAAQQLTGEHMWGGLAFEVARVAHAMDMVGLHEPADKVYQHFLKAPGAKPDGDYVDGQGALEWATSMRHDMGYSHDGTHASTGRLLFAMCERAFLTGDEDWFRRQRPRLQAAADWIIRQRSLYMQDVANRDELFVAGLLPPSMLGDYAIPSCDWRWYYVDNALAVQGLQRFADALMGSDRKAGRRYLREAEAYRKDLRRVVEKEAAMSPVRRGRDGLYHSYIPRMAYARGLTGPELGAPQFPETDLWMGSLPLAEPHVGIAAADPRLVDTLEVMEEMGTSTGAVSAKEEARKQQGLASADAWFWHSYSILPKASHTANAYLLQDDIPGFLRFWMNSYAAMVGADGKLWEHAHLGNYDVCGAPDNGTAGWFLENFRNLLVMEEGDSLWVARGTPRSWLEPGKRVAVAHAPTHFGDLAYEIISDADKGSITATLSLPERRPIESVILRLRHPQARPIKGVMVNGRRWTRFDTAKETIRLAGLQGQVVVIATY